MRNLLIISFFLISCFIQAQTIKDERSVNWVYGQGNNNIAIVFEGGWSTLTNPAKGEYGGDYKYQILETSNNIVRDIDSSAYYGEVKIKAFRDQPEWDCIRDQSLVLKSVVNENIEAVYNVTTNPTRTDITTCIKNLDIGTKNGYDGKLSQYGFIVPGTFRINAGALTVTDDGNGNLIGNVAAGVNKINYGGNSMASINVTFSATVLKTTAITATYNYKYFPYKPYEGFLQIQDLPAKIYTFLFVDNKGYRLKANYPVTASKTLEITQDSTFTYKNQLIQIQ